MSESLPAAGRVAPLMRDIAGAFLGVIHGIMVMAQ